VAFAARQEALRQNPGRPLDRNQMNTLRAAQPPRAPMVRPVSQPAPAAFGRPVNGNPQPAMRPQPAVRDDRPPTAQPGARPAVEQPRPADRPAPHPVEQARPAEARPNVEAHSEAPPAKQGSKANEKNNKRSDKKNDKTEKKDR
jgi:protein TonB